MQLDIFDHSRDIMLRNDVVDALERRDASTARAAWLIFSKEFPLDDTLSPLAVLIDALEHRTCASFLDHGAVSDARRLLNSEIAPAAVRTFGKKAGATWLAPLWQEMAQRSAQLSFRPDRSEAEARYRVYGLEGAWALLAELAWLSPGRFDRLTKRLADPPLEKLRNRFDASFEGDGEVADLAWFPAWVLTEKPGLSRLLGETQHSLHSAPEQAMRLLLELLGLERQGRHHDMVERRKALRDVHPSLYAAYMATR
jgi:hypothetical protein